MCRVAEVTKKAELTEHLRKLQEKVMEQRLTHQLLCCLQCRVAREHSQRLWCCLWSQRVLVQGCLQCCCCRCLLLPYQQQCYWSLHQLLHHQQYCWSLHFLLRNW